MLANLTATGGRYVAQQRLDLLIKLVCVTWKMPVPLPLLSRDVGLHLAQIVAECVRELEDESIE